MRNKKGFEFSFGWIFAIIVGAVIIFLAIYASTNIVKQQRNVQDTSAGKEIGILLSPVETSLESDKKTIIIFPVETRVYNNCKVAGTFGSQGISVASRSGIGEEWQKAGVESTFYNKYIFSASTIEMRSANVIAKPLKFPYKVADLIFVFSAESDYCFVNPPEEIEDEITDLQINNINITSDLIRCKRGATRVCFYSTGCDIEVNLNSQSVKKDGRIIFYAEDENNALLYGAIFADPGIYECQIKRLMKRSSELALLYNAKSQYVAPRGCNSNLEGDLILYANQTLALNSSVQLTEIQMYSDELERRNNALSCKLF